VVIALAAGAAYHNSFSGVLLFDDRTAITENASIRQWWPPGPAWSPPAESGTGGRPFANFTFAVNYAVSGFGVWSYHALNLVLHALAAVTLFGVVRRTLLQPDLRSRFGTSAVPLALAVATLWCVHPLLTGTVNYLSQRTELLMALCYLVTLYCFIRSTEASQSIWRLLAVAACLLGLASKEVMVTAPVMVWLYDRTFVAGSFRAAWWQRPRFYAALGATWIVLGWLMTDIARRGVGFESEVSWWVYALTECRAVVRYLQLALWPHPLVLDYGVEWVRHVSAALPYALVLAPLLAGTLLALWRRPVLGFAGGAFFLILAPTSSVVPIFQQPVAESRLYLPLAAVLTLLVLGSHALLGRRNRIVIPLLAIVLGVLTVQRNPLYSDEESIWRDTLARRPTNARALNNLASAVFKAGRTAEAMTIWAQALRLRPDDADVHNNLGFALIQSERLAEALPHLEAAVRLEPAHAEAHHSLGLALARLGVRPAEAIRHYEESLRLKPNAAPAHNNLALALATLPGRLPDALTHFQAALRLDPNYHEAHYNLATTLEKLPGRAPDAIAHYEAALRAKPDLMEAHFNLAVLHAKMDGRLPDAIAHYEQALRLKPTFAEAEHGLGLALAQAGRLDEAIAHLEAAIRLDPNSAGARANLERLKSIRTK